MKTEVSPKKRETIRDMCSSNPDRGASPVEPRKSKRQKRPATRPVSTDAKLELITTLFKNAKANITRMEEEKAASKPKTGPLHGPEVRIVNGKVVLDDRGLIDAVNIDQMPDAPRRTVTEVGNRVSRTKRTHSDRWTPPETEQFYMALQLFGTDFCMISNFLEKRTRHQVKSKYKKESKLYPTKIEYATKTQPEISKQAYQQFTEELKTLTTAFANSQ